jgi:hypothetical protein
VPAVAFKQPLRDSAVAELASIVLDLHPIQDVLRANKLLSRDVFFHPARFATPQSTGLRNLQGSLALMDAAIAFQNLLQGDLIVVDMAAHSKEEPVKAALEHNVLLAMNVAREIIYSRMDALCVESDPGKIRPGCNTLPNRYGAALRAPTSADLVLLLEQSNNKLPDSIVGSAGSYQMKIGGLSVPLPTAEELRERTYVSSPALEQLWRIRDALLDAEAGYSMRGGLQGSNVQALSAQDQQRLSVLLAIQ